MSRSLSAVITTQLDHRQSESLRYRARGEYPLCSHSYQRSMAADQVILLPSDHPDPERPALTPSNLPTQSPQCGMRRGRPRKKTHCCPRLRSLPLCDKDTLSERISRLHKEPGVNDPRQPLDTEQAGARRTALAPKQNWGLRPHQRQRERGFLKCLMFVLAPTNFLTPRKTPEAKTAFNTKKHQKCINTLWPALGVVILMRRPEALCFEATNHVLQCRGMCNSKWFSEKTWARRGQLCHGYFDQSSGKLFK